MNIFALHSEPSIAAQYHCDKHVVKMIVETAQMLCTVKHIHGEEAPYKPSFKNHPCTIWARESEENYQWLCELGTALCSEFERRYGKEHKTKGIIQFCYENAPVLPDDVGLTPFVCAMPDHCKISDDPIENYREFYRKEKSRFAKWKNTPIPEWYDK